MASIPAILTAVNTVERGKHYQVLSTDGQRWYDVTINGEKLTCNCLAGIYNRPCKHTSQVEAVLAADNWNNFATKVNARAVAKGIVSAERIDVEQAEAEANRKRLISGQPPVRTYKLGDGSTYTASSIADELSGVAQ